ncbi:hypothetical protein PENTCL1PPCAC_27020, partial [Pristionchus entomophagus]
MNYLPLISLCFLIYHIAAQGCGCRGSSSCGQEGSGFGTSGCSGGALDNNYSNGDSYQRDEKQSFKGSLERLGSKRRGGRHGKRGERRGRKYDDEEEDEDDDRYKIGSLNSVNYDGDYDDNDKRRKPTKIRDPKKRRFRYKRAKRDTEPETDRSGGLCNSLLIRRGLETGMTSLLNSNQTTPLSLSPASSLHALMKTRSKKASSPWGIICGSSDALDQLDLSIDTKMYCYHQVGETSCFAFKI